MSLIETFHFKNGETYSEESYCVMNLLSIKHIEPYFPNKLKSKDIEKVEYRYTHPVKFLTEDVIRYFELLFSIPELSSDVINNVSLDDGGTTITISSSWSYRQAVFALSIVRYSWEYKDWLENVFKFYDFGYDAKSAIYLGMVFRFDENNKFKLTDCRRWSSGHSIISIDTCTKNSISVFWNIWNDLNTGSFINKSPGKQIDKILKEKAKIDCPMTFGIHCSIDDLEDYFKKLGATKRNV